MNSGFGGEKILDQKIYHVVLLVEPLLAVAARYKSVHFSLVQLSQRG